MRPYAALDDSHHTPFRKGVNTYFYYFIGKRKDVKLATSQYEERS